MPSVALYNFSKRINSTKRPSGSGTTFSCAINEPGSIGKHTLTLKITSATAPDYNYAVYNGKYYYIKDISNDINNIWYLYLEEDDLATHKSAIGNTRAFIRYSSQGSFYKSDPRIPFEPHVQTYTYSSNLSYSASDFTGLRSASDLGVYGVIGLAGDIGGTLVYCNITDFFYQLNNLNDTIKQQIADVYGDLYGMILFAKAYPWSVGFSLTDTIAINGNNITSGKYLKMDTVLNLYTCSVDSGIITDSIPFKALCQYSDYKVRCPYYGYVSLDSRNVITNDTSYRVTANIATSVLIGKGLLKLDVIENAISIASYFSQVGVDVPVGKTDPNSAMNALAGIKTAVGVVGGAAATIGGLATGNIPVAGAGVASLIGTATKAATAFNFNENYHKVLSASDTGAGMLFTGGACTLIATMPITVSSSLISDKDIAGAPYYGYGLVKNFGPFVLCDCASVEIDESPEVINAINSALSSGLYYE